MRLIDINFDDFKGIDAEFDEFAPALVLFGPNDTGKTNLLEAFQLVLGTSGQTMVRRGPRRDTDDWSNDTVYVAATVELQELQIEGSLDREFLRAALVRHVSWPEDELPEEDRDKGWRLTNLPEHVLSHADREDLDRVCAVVGGLMLGWAKERCSDWQVVERTTNPS